MILSMTGYGTASCQADGMVVAVEIRSVNHRFLDLHVRVSREYSFLENEIQQTARNLLKRGRVDVTVTIRESAPAEILVNEAAAKNYIQAAKRLCAELGVEYSMDAKTLLMLPGVLQNRDAALPGAEEIDRGPVARLTLEGVRQALEGVLAMRRQEGSALQADLLRHLAGVDEKAKSIQSLGPASLLEYRQKLEDRLAQLLPENGIDPQRIAQEVALAAERSDISEEITRLESHVIQYRELIQAGNDVGKRMDFLLQEMQREVNTILAKSGNLEITRHGIAIKADIEKLREQVQNVE